ncbi:hypothetical protein PR048_011082 [Dryococelus australis]|uniref:Uncharacterized protein n=1 Tax=Dryococelus australis TaxID=614101 RepID=A0ABQ9HLA3_9NEOP|nr:hypothetical protein PR048_011082 [Dryococelus australis]
MLCVDARHTARRTSVSIIASTKKSTSQIGDGWCVARIGHRIAAPKPTPSWSILVDVILVATRVCSMSITGGGLNCDTFTHHWLGHTHTAEPLCPPAMAALVATSTYLPLSTLVVLVVTNLGSSSTLACLCPNSQNILAPPVGFFSGWAVTSASLTTAHHSRASQKKSGGVSTSSLEEGRIEMGHPHSTAQTLGACCIVASAIIREQYLITTAIIREQDLMMAAVMTAIIREQYLTDATTAETLEKKSTTRLEPRNLEIDDNGSESLRTNLYLNTIDDVDISSTALSLSILQELTLSLDDLNRDYPPFIETIEEMWDLDPASLYNEPELKSSILDSSINLTMRNQTLAVNDARAGLIVFLLGYPHLLEGGQGSQDGAADPDRVLPLRGSNDLDLDRGWCEGGDLLLHPVSNTWVHCGATRKNSVGVKVLTDVHITLHDGVVHGFVDSTRFHTQEGRLEQSLRAAETFVTDGDDLSIRQFVRLLQGSRGSRSSHFLLEVQGHIAQLLLDISYNFPLSRGGEAVSTLCQDLHQVVSQIATGQVQTQDGVGQSITFVNGDGVRYTVTRVEHDTCGTTGGVQRKHGLDCDVHGGGVERFEHDLGHLLPVGLGVERSLGQQDGVFLWSYSKFVVEGVMPDLLHIVPVGNDAVFDGIFKGEDTSLGLCLVADVAILLTHTHHHTLVTGSANDGREHRSRGVITGEPGLAHAGAIVHDQCCNVIVTHVGCLLVSVLEQHVAPACLSAQPAATPRYLYSPPPRVAKNTGRHTRVSPPVLLLFRTLSSPAAGGRRDVTPLGCARRITDFVNLIGMLVVVVRRLSKKLEEACACFYHPPVQIAMSTRNSNANDKILTVYRTHELYRMHIHCWIDSDPELPAPQIGDTPTNCATGGRLLTSNTGICFDSNPGSHCRHRCLLIIIKDLWLLVPCGRSSDASSLLIMERQWNERAGERGDTRKNPLTRHDSHLRKSGSEPAGY